MLTSTISPTNARRTVRLIGALLTAALLALAFMATAARADTAANMNSAFNETNGTTGWLVAKTSGTAVSSKNAGTVFEPASAIKFVPHLHAELKIQANPAVKNHSTPPWKMVPNSSCPTPDNSPGVFFGDPVQDAMSKMMWQSDNASTAAIVEHFGQASINQTAQSQGTTNTLIQHRHGCGADAIAKPNKWTLNDAALLYRKAFTGSLLTTANRDHMWQRMPNQMQQFKDMADFEAQWSFGGQDPPAAFLNGIKVAYKAGGYTLCHNPCRYYRAIAGYVELPVKSIYGPMPRRFTFGLFIHGATVAESIVNEDFNAGISQIMREEIVKALDTWL
jgi:beta-lactamase class A